MLSRMCRFDFKISASFPSTLCFLRPLHDSYLRLAVQTQLHRHGHLLQPRSHCALRLRALEPIVVELREDLLLHCAFKQSTRRCVLSRSNENRFDSSFARGSDGWLRAHLRYWKILLYSSLWISTMSNEGWKRGTGGVVREVGEPRAEELVEKKAVEEMADVGTPVREVLHEVRKHDLPE